jgi:hypothetical protein
MTDSNHSGQQSFSTAEVNAVHIEELIQMDRCVTLQHMTSDLGLPYSTVQHIVVICYGIVRSVPDGCLMN